MTSEAGTPVLDVEQLSVRFRLGWPGYRQPSRRQPGAVVRAVTDVSFAPQPGQLLALVGESGCGKSVLAAALLGLLPANADVRGRAVLAGSGPPVDLVDAPESELAGSVRGRRIGLVPQSAATSLTPVRTAGVQLAEAVHALRLGVGEPAAVVDELATRVGLDRGALARYSHELSGGTAQRVAMALALAGDPDVVLADEPTTGLDRPLVHRTVDALTALAAQGRAVLMITHDLDAARRAATHLAVMYASRIVELGPARDVLTDPWHPYTAGLLRALPEAGFTPIPGHPPELTALPDGCAFRPRCGVTESCSDDPAPVRFGDRLVACHRPC